jgi:hypothetical protein
MIGNLAVVLLVPTREHAPASCASERSTSIGQLMDPYPHVHSSHDSICYSLPSCMRFSEGFSHPEGKCFISTNNHAVCPSECLQVTDQVRTHTLLFPKILLSKSHHALRYPTFNRPSVQLAAQPRRYDGPQWFISGYLLSS